jgi:transposase
MLPSSVRIFVCTEPQDMRRSFDTLALVTRQLLGADPQSGALFVFVSRRATRVKVLWWDHNGYCLLYKRLHRALFRIPKAPPGAGPGVMINASAFGQLLAGIPHEGK